MKHRLCLLIFLICSLASYAQTGLNIADMFGEKYSNNENSTETYITGDALDVPGLKIYRSLVIQNTPEAAEEIAAAVIKDGAKASSRKVKYIDGKLYYAQYMLAPKGKDNRYIFYVNAHLKGGNRILLLYMSGKAKLNEIKIRIDQL